MTAEQQNASNGELFEAMAATIAGRRSVKQFAPVTVPHQLIERLIEAAVWAPNHRLTEPWRFYVLSGESRQKLGEIARAITLSKALASGGQEQSAMRKAEEAADAWGSVPVLLYVTTIGDQNSEIDLENYGAVCCAVQNIMLLAHSAGLGTSWSSGAVAAAPELHALAGAGADERMVALLRLGYPAPDASTPSARRKPSANLTRWVDEDA